MSEIYLLNKSWSNNTDTKALLKSTSHSSKQRISQGQINQLIHHIVNDSMGVTKASRKVKIGDDAAYYYYNVYKNDPDKKIPLPRAQHTHTPRVYTQEQIGNLIKYVGKDKMTVKEASVRLNMTHSSGRYYYNKYLKDPNHTINMRKLQQHYTQDQKNKFIGYIINDKMNITAASKKAKLGVQTGQSYYRKYFKQENHDFPTHIVTPKCYTQEQIKELIGYIINDNMSIAAASIKANMGLKTARRHYRSYINNNNRVVPARKSSTRYTQDQINELIEYAMDDKMSIEAASEKVNMSYITGRKYYSQYLNEKLQAGIYSESFIKRLLESL